MYYHPVYITRWTSIPHGADSRCTHIFSVIRNQLISSPADTQHGHAGHPWEERALPTAHDAAGPAVLAARMWERCGGRRTCRPGGCRKCGAAHPELKSHTGAALGPAHQGEGSHAVCPACLMVQAARCAVAQCSGPGRLPGGLLHRGMHFKEQSMACCGAPHCEHGSLRIALEHTRPLFLQI